MLFQQGIAVMPQVWKTNWGCYDSSIAILISNGRMDYQ